MKKICIALTCLLMVGGGISYYFFSNNKSSQSKTVLDQPDDEQQNNDASDNKQVLVMKNVTLQEGSEKSQYHYLVRAQQAGFTGGGADKDNDVVVCNNVQVTVFKDDVEVGTLRADLCRIDRIKKEGVLTGNLSGTLLNSQVQASRVIFDLSHDTIELQDVQSELVISDIERLDSTSGNDGGN
ncbi:MAG: hypothetical protein H6679_00515 [Epsilonproteobacteria bacterium]|nr:hypothetical protein [Campylobacterota bacterium]